MASREGSRRVGGPYDPGRDAAARYPDWVIRHCDLRGIPEVMDVRRRVILIDRHQVRGARRSSLAHAIAHLDLGHVVIDGHLGARQEVEAERLAASRLIPTGRLVDAIRWCGEHWPTVATTLDVDEPLLRARMQCLSPGEAAQLRDGLAAYLDLQTA